MSDRNRTPEEYIKRHARDYCNGDKEKAKKHKIVQEVLKEKTEKGLPKMNILEYLNGKGIDEKLRIPEL